MSEVMLQQWSKPAQDGGASKLTHRAMSCPASTLPSAALPKTLMCSGSPATAPAPSGYPTVSEPFAVRRCWSCA